MESLTGSKRYKCHNTYNETLFKAEHLSANDFWTFVGPAAQKIYQFQLHCFERSPGAFTSQQFGRFGQLTARAGVFQVSADAA